MGRKNAGLGGTLYVTLAVLGVLILAGVIAWMMVAGPKMRHSPERGSVSAPGIRLQVTGYR
jgi:hypothetical protein